MKRYCTVQFKKKKSFFYRILRSDTFNPAIRIKNAPEPEVVEEEPKEEAAESLSSSEKYKREREKRNQITPAEYRRVQG